MVEDVTISNGLGWSPDGTTMYYIDSMAYRVDRFDFDVATGEIADRRPFIVIERGGGIPTGSQSTTTAASGSLWGRGSIRRYSSDGELEQVLAVPVDKVTACCFGGEDGRSLYVTTASVETRASSRSRAPSSWPKWTLRAARRSRSQADPVTLRGEEDGAFGGGADESAIAREDAAGVAQRRRLPVGEALGELGLLDVDGELLAVDVDRDRVAVPDDGERAAARRLRRDVPHHEAARGAREASVGDERDRLAQPGADDRGGHAQRSRIPGPPAGPSYRTTSTSPARTCPIAPPRCRPPRCRTRARARCASGARCRRA